MPLAPSRSGDNDDCVGSSPWLLDAAQAVPPSECLSSRARESTGCGDPKIVPTDIAQSEKNATSNRQRERQAAVEINLLESEQPSGTAEHPMKTVDVSCAPLQADDSNSGLHYDDETCSSSSNFGAVEMGSAIRLGKNAASEDGWPRGQAAQVDGDKTLSSVAWAAPVQAVRFAFHPRSLTVSHGGGKNCGQASKIVLANTDTDMRRDRVDGSFMDVSVQASPFCSGASTAVNFDSHCTHDSKLRGGHFRESESDMASVSIVKSLTELEAVADAPRCGDSAACSGPDGRVFSHAILSACVDTDLRDNKMDTQRPVVPASTSIGDEGGSTELGNVCSGWQARAAFNMDNGLLEVAHDEMRTLADDRTGVEAVKMDIERESTDKLVVAEDAIEGFSSVDVVNMRTDVRRAAYEPAKDDHLHQHAALCSSKVRSLAQDNDDMMCEYQSNTLQTATGAVNSSTGGRQDDPEELRSGVALISCEGMLEAHMAPLSSVKTQGKCTQATEFLNVTLTASSSNELILADASATRARLLPGRGRPRGAESGGGCRKRRVPAAQLRSLKRSWIDTSLAEGEAEMKRRWDALPRDAATQELLAWRYGDLVRRVDSSADDAVDSVDVDVLRETLDALISQRLASVAGSHGSTRSGASFSGGGGASASKEDDTTLSNAFVVPHPAMMFIEHDRDFAAVLGLPAPSESGCPSSEAASSRHEAGMIGALRRYLWLPCERRASLWALVRHRACLQERAVRRAVPEQASAAPAPCTGETLFPSARSTAAARLVSSAESCRRCAFQAFLASHSLPSWSSDVGACTNTGGSKNLADPIDLLQAEAHFLALGRAEQLWWLQHSRLSSAAAAEVHLNWAPAATAVVDAESIAC